MDAQVMTVYKKYHLREINFKKPQNNLFLFCFFPFFFFFFKFLFFPYCDCAVKVFKVDILKEPSSSDSLCKKRHFSCVTTFRI